MNDHSYAKYLLEHEQDIIEREKIEPMPCKSCGTLTEHARNLCGYCPACFVREGLTIRREYKEAEKPKMNRPFGSDMGD